MKKWIHSVIAVLLASICLLPSAAFAADNTDTVPEGGYIAADPTEDDVILTQEDLLILDAAEDYGATATGVDDLNQTIELLLAGRVDATLNAEVTYYDYMNQHPDANLKIAALTDEASLVCIPTRKGDDSASLREAINQAIAELSESGQLSELSEKYFGSDISHE